MAEVTTAEWIAPTRGRVIPVPTCDRCGTELWMHGATLAGQGCDLGAAMDDLWRALLVGVMGERRAARLWSETRARR